MEKDSFGNINEDEFDNEENEFDLEEDNLEQGDDLDFGFPGEDEAEGDDFESDDFDDDEEDAEASEDDFEGDDYDEYDEGDDEEDEDEDEQSFEEMEAALSQNEIDSLIGTSMNAQKSGQASASGGGNKIVGLAIYGLMGLVGLGGSYFAYTALSPMLFGGGSSVAQYDQQYDNYNDQDYSSYEEDQSYIPPSNNIMPGLEVPISNDIPTPPGMGGDMMSDLDMTNNVMDQTMMTDHNDSFGMVGTQEENQQTLPQLPVAPSVTVQPSNNEVIEKSLAEINKKMQGFEGAFDVIMTRLETLPNYFATKDEVVEIVNDVVTSKLSMMQPAQGNSDEVVDRLASLEKTIKQSSRAVDDNASHLSMLQNQIDYLMAANSSKSTPVVSTEAFDVKFAEINDTLNVLNDKVASLDEIVGKQKQTIRTLEKEKAQMAVEVAKAAKPVVVRGNDINPPRKPDVLTNFRLAGINKGFAWIDNGVGINKVAIGQNINGVGMLEDVIKVDGNWAAVTPMGLILP